MSRKIIIILHILSWTLLFIAGFSVYAQFIHPAVAFGRAFSNVGLVALLFYANTYAINNYYERNKKSLYATISVIGITIIMLIRAAINYLLADQSESAEISEKPFVYISFTILTTLIVYVFSGLFTLLQNRMRQEKENLAKLNQLQLSQLKFLKSQINPHFLFNTLNNIYSLVLSKSDQAPTMLVKLSELLRYAIYQGQNTKVPVATEVEQIEKYIDLFRMKSKRELMIRSTINFTDNACLIPPMLLISLIENAFKHSDISENEKGFVEFNLTVEKGKLYFLIKNSFKEKQQKDLTGGIGLSNIKETLEIIYPNKFRFNQSAEKNLFTINLKINYDN